MSKRQRMGATIHMAAKPKSTVGQHSRSFENNGEASADSDTSPCCSPEEIQRMIAIAAYFRAEHRGFAPDMKWTIGWQQKLRSRNKPANECLDVKV